MTSAITVCSFNKEEVLVSFSNKKFALYDRPQEGKLNEHPFVKNGSTLLTKTEAQDLIRELANAIHATENHYQ